jgi:hypothetical protein
MMRTFFDDIDFRKNRLSAEQRRLCNQITGSQKFAEEQDVNARLDFDKRIGNLKLYG